MAAVTLEEKLLVDRELSHALTMLMDEFNAGRSGRAGLRGEAIAAVRRARLRLRQGELGVRGPLEPLCPHCGKPLVPFEPAEPWPAGLVRTRPWLCGQHGVVCHELLDQAAG